VNIHRIGEKMVEKTSSLQRIYNKLMIEVLVDSVVKG
jgi:hypothetical protein